MDPITLAFLSGLVRAAGQNIGDRATRGPSPWQPVSLPMGPGRVLTEEDAYRFTGRTPIPGGGGPQLYSDPIVMSFLRGGGYGTA